MNLPANASDAASSPLTGLPLLLPDGMTMGNTYGAALLGTFFGLISAIIVMSTLRTVLGSGVTLQVALILLLDTVHSVVIMTSWLSYSKFVTHYSRISPLAIMDKSMSLLTTVTAANVVACQSLFAYRVYRTITVKVLQAEVGQAAFKYGPWISVSLAIAVFVDTVLAVMLVVWLHRSRTGVKSTNTLLDTLIAYAVTSGSLTDVFNILGFVFADIIILLEALATSQNLFYVTMNMVVTKVYTNSVMAAYALFLFSVSEILRSPY
ncbi:hypothetical protein LXA43DRAFT_1119746 [Ganoderma leucocontextum]|nr:hypothetical protein LXA43DRAFT_1119746 [Ganoderma leucocontextum]